MILVAGGSAAIRRLDADEQSSEETVLLDPGAWTWISPGLVHVLADGRDGDAVPVRVVEIELRGAEEARASARGRPRPSGSQTGPGSPRDPS